MEEDETLAEPTKIIEDKDTKIKSLEEDITQKNDKIIELENDDIKRDDDIFDLKREVNDLKIQVTSLDMDAQGNQILRIKNQESWDRIIQLFNEKREFIELSTSKMETNKLAIE